MKETTKLKAKYTSKNSKLAVKPEWTLDKIAGDKITLERDGSLKTFTLAQFEKNWTLVVEKVKAKPAAKAAPKAKATPKAKPVAKKEVTKVKVVAKTTPKAKPAAKPAAKKATAKAPTKKVETLKEDFTIEKKSFEDYKVKKAGKRVKLLLGKRVYEERNIFTKAGKEFFKFADKDYEVANTTVINHVYKIKYDIVDAGTKAEFHRNGQKVNSRQVKVNKEGKRYFRFNKEVYVLDEAAN